MQKLILTLGIIAIASAPAMPAFAGDAAAGKTQYMEHKCDKCHGEGGKGDGATAQKLKMDLADWTDKAAMEGMTDEFLHDIIAKGGKALGKDPKMPAYGKKLDKKAIEDIVAWIRSLSS